MIQFPRVPIPAGATAAHAAHTGDRTTTRRTPRDPLAYLGHDVFLNIAGQMNTVDLVAASQVCTAWRGKLLATTETWRAASRRSKVERLVPMPPAPNDGRTADFATMHQSGGCRGSGQTLTHSPRTRTDGAGVGHTTEDGCSGPTRFPDTHPGRLVERCHLGRLPRQVVSLRLEHLPPLMVV